MKYGPSDLIFIIVTIVTFFVSGLDKKRFRKRTGANLTKNFEFSYFQSKF